MIGSRTLGVISGFAVMAAMFAPLTVAAQLAADGAPVKAEAAPPAPAAKEQRDAPLASQSDGGPGSLTRPAAAFPPERIQVEPARRPSVDPKDDPRSVEESKGEPDATDR
jgi:hypothetical protein